MPRSSGPAPQRPRSPTKRAGNAAAGLFAAQAQMFTPESDGPALVGRRIHAGELLFLAGDIRRSLEHLQALDTDQLATADLERALPLLDMTDLVHGHGAATPTVARAVAAAGDDPRRRALVLGAGLRPGLRHPGREA